MVSSMSVVWRLVLVFNHRYEYVHMKMFSCSYWSVYTEPVKTEKEKVHICLTSITETKNQTIVIEITSLYAIPYTSTTASCAS